MACCPLGGLLGGSEEGFVIDGPAAGVEVGLEEIGFFCEFRFSAGGIEGAGAGATGHETGGFAGDGDTGEDVNCSAQAQGVKADKVIATVAPVAAVGGPVLDHQPCPPIDLAHMPPLA